MCVNVCPRSRKCMYVFHRVIFNVQIELNCFTFSINIHCCHTYAHTHVTTVCLLSQVETPASSLAGV